MLNIEDIQKILPHRFPFALIDRVLEVEPQKRIVALKNVTFNEEYFSGHFPKSPIMPGVLIIEAMAQASIILMYPAENQSSKNHTYYLGSVKARFLDPVLPGDQLVITVEALKIISNAAVVKGKATVMAKEVASAELSFMLKENE